MAQTAPDPMGLAGDRGKNRRRPPGGGRRTDHPFLQSGGRIAAEPKSSDLVGQPFDHSFIIARTAKFRSSENARAGPGERGPSKSIGWAESHLISIADFRSASVRQAEGRFISNVSHELRTPRRPCGIRPLIPTGYSAAVTDEAEEIPGRLHPERRSPPPHRGYSAHLSKSKRERCGSS